MCPSIKCKYERLQKQKIQWGKDNRSPAQNEDFECPYCHKIVPKVRYDRRTCGNRKCINKHENHKKLLGWAKKDDAARNLGAL